MKFLHHSPQTEGFYNNNPLNGVSNLFDLVPVFTVGLLLALLSGYHLDVPLKEDATTTITGQSASGKTGIIVKYGTKVDTRKDTNP